MEQNMYEMMTQIIIFRSTHLKCPLIPNPSHLIPNP
jgi:hypothetical protein